MQHHLDQQEAANQQYGKNYGQQVEPAIDECLDWLAKTIDGGGNQEKPGRPGDGRGQDKRDQSQLKDPGRNGKDLIGNWGKASEEYIQEPVVRIWP